MKSLCIIVHKKTLAAAGSIGEDPEIRGPISVWILNKILYQSVVRWTPLPRNPSHSPAGRAQFGACLLLSKGCLPERLHGSRCEHAAAAVQIRSEMPAVVIIMIILLMKTSQDAINNWSNRIIPHSPPSSSALGSLQWWPRRALCKTSSAQGTGRLSASSAVLPALTPASNACTQVTEWKRADLVLPRTPADWNRVKPSACRLPGKKQKQL